MTPTEADRLCVTLMPLASRCARRWAAGRQDFDDVRSVALLALVQACRGYDAARGVPLEAYVWQRMTWAVQDYFRRLDPTGFQRQTKRARRPELCSLSALPVDEGVGGWYRSEAAMEARILVRQAVARVSGRARAVLAGRFAGLEHATIARALGCSPSLVCLIQQDAVATVRQAWGIAA